jgi:predicted RNase H-like nuclease (RuvC/YqgF family)
MSFEDAYNNPYREVDDLWKELREKDAEIEGLKDELKIAASKTDVQAYDRVLEELAEKDAEIARLKKLLCRAAEALDNGDLAILEEMREAGNES